jgi:Na+-transporting methylmalonyl-CoA/oxaloacetate decarboxylase gamma subunit
MSPQGITALVLPIASGTGVVFAFLYSLAAVVAGAAVLFGSSALGKPNLSLDFRFR